MSKQESRQNNSSNHKFLQLEPNLSASGGSGPPDVGGGPETTHEGPHGSHEEQVRQQRRAEAHCEALFQRLRNASFWKFRCECLEDLGHVGGMLKSWGQLQASQHHAEIMQAVISQTKDWKDKVRCSALNCLAILADR